VLFVSVEEEVKVEKSCSHLQLRIASFFSVTDCIDSLNDIIVAAEFCDRASLFKGREFLSLFELLLFD
jgi:hypothetical protein